MAPNIAPRAGGSGFQRLKNFRSSASGKTCSTEAMETGRSPESTAAIFCRFRAALANSTVPACCRRSSSSRSEIGSAAKARGGHRRSLNRPTANGFRKVRESQPCGLLIPDLSSSASSATFGWPTSASSPADLRMPKLMRLTPSKARRRFHNGGHRVAGSEFDCRRRQQPALVLKNRVGVPFLVAVDRRSTLLSRIT